MSFTTIRYSSAPENRRSSDYSASYSANPGLIEEVDGYYDWAGRRLFLADHSPDPMTPGAYRYQTRPDLCDLAAPTSDPASPQYEPPHLRHQPGDTWIIDRDRPHDPDDPGPFGSVGWRPDRRTGRHRRGELPDPIPPWEQESAASEPPTSSGSVPPRKSGPRAPSPTSDAEEPSTGESSSPTWRFRVEPDRPSPSSSSSPLPRRSPRPWPEVDCQAAEDRSGPSPHRADDPHRFDKLREAAWDRFLIKSAPLAAAHWADRTALECEGGPVFGRLVRLVRRGIRAIRTTRRGGAPREAQGARIESTAGQPESGIGSDLAGGAAWA